MDNLDLLFSLNEYEWTFYSIHRLNYYQYQPEYLRQELIRQIWLEHEFRSIVDEILEDTFE